MTTKMPLVPEDVSREEERGDVRNTSDACALEGGDTAAVLEVGSSGPMTEFKLKYMPIR